MAIALSVEDSQGPLSDPEHVAAVVGGEPVTLERIAAILSKAGWKVAAATARAEHAAAVCNGKRPSAVVARLDLDGRDAPAVLEEVRQAFPDSVVVVVTQSPLGCDVRRALRAGADGIVDEAQLEATLAPTVHAGHAGLVSVPRRLREHVTRPILSHREKQILSLVAAGATNREIANRLYLAESTIKNHLSSVFVKLGVRSRAEAAAALDPAEALFEPPWAVGFNGDGAA